MDGDSGTTRTTVLARFVSVVEEQSAVAVARLTADCPLISPTVVDEVVRTYVSANVDYVSNTLEPTYPDGLDVGKLSALRRSCASRRKSQIRMSESM